ncbi:MAG TPA: DUF998 domain-containing protein, partial [Galbitalea sp.]
ATAPATPATRLWVNLALAGILLYVVVDIALALLRPDYSLLKNYESDYGRGTFAWLMDVNFVLRGLLSAFAIVALRRVGITRGWMAVLLRIWAVGSALLALFPDNPVGYPHLVSGGIHLIIAGIAFLAIAVATLGMSFGSASRGRFVVARRVLAIVGAVALLLLLHPFGAPGLVERTFLAAELGWLALALVSVDKVDRG